MQRIFQELRIGQAPAVIYTSVDRFPTLKVDCKEFPAEHEDCNTWSRMHQVQHYAPGCVDGSIANGEDDVKLGMENFGASNINPERLRTAHPAWVLLITTCKVWPFTSFKERSHPVRHGQNPFSSIAPVVS